MKKDKFCINRTLLLFSLLVLVMLFTIPYIFSNQKNLSYKSSAQVIIPTPTPLLTSDPNKVLNYWVDYVRLNPYSNARRKFVNVGNLGLDTYQKRTYPYLLSGNYTNADELILINNYIFKQRLVSGFSGNQNDYEFLFEIDDKIVHESEDSLLCSFGGNFDNPFSFLIFYTTRSKYLGGDNPNTKLTLFRNKINGKTEGFISAWWASTEIDVHKNLPQIIKYIPYESFLNGFKYVLQQTKKPLTNDKHSLEGCGDYRIEKGISVNPKGQWWKFAEGTLQDVKVKETGSQLPYGNILPTPQPVGGVYFQNVLETAIARQFPELVIGPYEISKKLQFLTSFQKLNYLIDGGCDNKQSNYSKMLSYFEYMERFENPHIYMTRLRMNRENPGKAVAARSFINFINSSCQSNSYSNDPLSCLETCYLTYTPKNSFYISFEPLEDSIKGYNAKCSGFSKSIEFLVMTDESACFNHDADPLFK